MLKRNLCIAIILLIIGCVSGFFIGLFSAQVEFGVVNYTAINESQIVFRGSVDDYDSDDLAYWDLNYIYLRGGDGNNPMGAYFRFDLRNKPNNYEKCEISLYKYSVDRTSTYTKTFRIDIFEGNWDNITLNTEIYWKTPNIGHMHFSVGFERIDITNYIQDNDTVSIRIYPYGSYTNTIRYYLYSIQWDGGEPLLPYTIEEGEYKEYLPQLIWS